MGIFFKKTATAIVLFMLILSSFGQSMASDSENSFVQIRAIAESEYGVDQQLVNGVYFEDVYRGANGHPYFPEDRFHEGSLVYKSKYYKGVSIKYDIYSQQLLLSYLKGNNLGNNGLSQQIISELEKNKDLSETDKAYSLLRELNKSSRNSAEEVVTILTDQYIEDFEISGMVFRKVLYEDERKMYFQVVSDSKILKCYYYWYKERYEMLGSNDLKIHSFSESKRKCYLVTGNQWTRYRNNSSFIRALPDSVKRQAKLYMKTKKIKVKTATDNEVDQILDFCVEEISRA